VHKRRLARDTERILALGSVSTVCQTARCPNIGECFTKGTATFLILGPKCTRRCGFCAVPKGSPSPPDPGEPERVAACAAELGLSHVVITSTTRDDLSDGGAGRFAQTVRSIRSKIPDATVEILVPDFQGQRDSLEAVLASKPDVLNHNLETVSRLYPIVRAGADYQRSLRLLELAAAKGMLVKSGFMVGLGEESREVIELLRDLYSFGCRIVTIGQYIRPTPRNLTPARYVHPAEFASYKEAAYGIGFRVALSEPFVRSSFGSEEVLKECRSSSGQ
jgi:lipoic acid synthetase